MLCAYKNTSLLNLPPTSRSIEGHIYRSLYIIRQQSSLLSEAKPNLKFTEYGWFVEPNMLVKPAKYMLLPDTYYIRYGCK